jgi:hypothetical protein
MVKCPKCKSEDYEEIYIDDYSYYGDEITILIKARCCECKKEFWVKEFFTFDNAKNVL